MSEFIPRATRFMDLPASFALRRGGHLDAARIAYETVGTLNTARDNAVLIMPGLSPDAHVCSHSDDPSPGWWEEMVGPGKPIDTQRWHVVCVNSLGGCKGSTGPASINPMTGMPYRLTYPELSVEDIADAAAHTIRALGIEQLACIVGSSMGAMSTLALAARHPGLAKHMINISGAVSAQPFALAIRAIQREAIQSDPNWNNGQYDEARYPTRGMVLARKLGFLTYRSAEEWSTRFGRDPLGISPGIDAKPFGMEFAIEGYLECQAHRFVRGFDPNAYLYLSQSIDWFDLGESCNCSPYDALARLRLDSALVIGVDTDILFPLAQQRQIADGLRSGGAKTTFLPLESPAGHDAFLVDTSRFGPPIAAFLSARAPVGSVPRTTSMLTAA